MYGNLYLVSTPIGNLEDLTFRAVKILSSVDIILAESIERTYKLLSHYDIDTKVISFNKDNEKRKIKNKKIFRYFGYKVYSYINHYIKKQNRECCNKTKFFSDKCIY